MKFKSVNQKRIITIILWISVVLLMTATGFAKEYPKLSGADFSDVSRSLPQSQEYQVEQYDPKGHCSQINYRLTVDNKTGQVIVEESTNDYTATTHLNTALQFVNNHVVLKNKEVIKKNSLDKIEYYYDREKQAIVGKEYFQDKIKKINEQKYPLEIYQLMDFDMTELFLQGLLTKGMTNFNSNIALDGSKYNVNFVMEKTSWQPEKKYKFPDKFVATLKKYNQLLIYSGEPTGATKLVFPHKYYYAYEINPPYKIVATWGGNPKECTYKIYRGL